MESTIELHTKGFKDFSKQLANITVQLRTVNAELKKTNQLVKELIDLKDKLESQLFLRLIFRKQLFAFLSMIGNQFYQQPTHPIHHQEFLQMVCRQIYLH